MAADRKQAPVGPTVDMPLMAVADIQDSLLVVMNDLQRLEGLLSHATSNLMERFGTANAELAASSVANAPELAQARAALQAAVTELQFHDMSTQLIVHISAVLRGCAHRLANETMEQEDDEVEAPVVHVPDRPNPVTQSEMDAGSIELF
jgi:hypothetical protein